MNTHALKLNICLIMMSVICSSCNGDNSLNVGFRNMGNENIFAFDSKIGEYRIGSGLLTFKNEKSTHLYFKGSFEYPDTIIVKWRKPDESLVTKTVPVKSQIPKDFRTSKDEIIFNIFPDDTVKLSFVIQTGEYDTKEIDSQGNEVDYGKKQADLKH